MDNQITTENKGLLSWFESSMPSFNRLMRTANLTINVQQEDDFTIIPVNIFKNGKKSHEIETGILQFCEHIETENNNCLKCGEWQDC